MKRNNEALNNSHRLYSFSFANMTTLLAKNNLNSYDLIHKANYVILETQ